MNELNLLLIVKVYNEKKYFEIYSERKITIEEIKKRCQKEFKYVNEDINNINLWFIEKDNKKNLIINDNDLITYAQEIEPLHLSIVLNANIDIKKEDDNIYKIEEKKEKDKIKNDKNKNKYEIDLDIKNEEIKELKKQIENLNNEINYYKDKMEKQIIYYEKTIVEINNKLQNKIVNEKNFKNDKNLYNIIEENDKDNINMKQSQNIIINNNNSVINFKIKEDHNLLNSNEFEFKMLLNNNKNIENGKIYSLQNLDFINNICHNCNEKCLKSIYKCVICDNLFLCNNCYKNNKKKIFHQHYDFFEINYPKNVIKQIEDNIIFNNIINRFYELLRNIFFENGNISLKPINDADFKKLIKICKEMKSINVKPLDYFSEYQKVIIFNEFKKLNSETDKWQFSQKESLFLENLKKAVLKI